MEPTQQKKYSIPKPIKQKKHTFLPIVMTSEVARHRLDVMKNQINLIKSMNKLA